KCDAVAVREFAAREFDFRSSCNCEQRTSESCALREIFPFCKIETPRLISPAPSSFLRALPSSEQPAVFRSAKPGSGEGIPDTPDASFDTNTPTRSEPHDPTIVRRSRGAGCGDGLDHRAGRSDAEEGRLADRRRRPPARRVGAQRNAPDEEQRERHEAAVEGQAGEPAAGEARA